jgi:hypothetical protein
MTLTELWFKNPTKPPFKVFRTPSGIQNSPDNGASSLTVVEISMYCEESPSQGGDSIFFHYSYADDKECHGDYTEGSETAGWERIEAIRKW